MGGEPSLEIIEALTHIPSWTAGATSIEQYKNGTMNAGHWPIDDEGVDALTGALASSPFRVLGLSSNGNISTRGCQSLAGSWKNPNT